MVVSQKRLNKINVAYNKGLRICTRALKSTSIHALETEAGSVPLRLRRSYLTRKEILKSYEFDLPISQRLNDLRSVLDVGNLTFLERNSIEIQDITDRICKAQLSELPDNLNVSTILDNDVLLYKKDLSNSQWKRLADSKISQEFHNHYKVYTDASKQRDGRTGIGITDLRRVRSSERISELFQISNAELVAMLKAIHMFEESKHHQLAIFTDSLNGYRWLKEGQHDNYLVHFIRKETSRFQDRTISIQWIPGHAGIEGNTEADSYANQGCYLEHFGIENYLLRR